MITDIASTFDYGYHCYESIRIWGGKATIVEHSRLRMEVINSKEFIDAKTKLTQELLTKEEPISPQPIIDCHLVHKKLNYKPLNFVL